MKKIGIIGAMEPEIVRLKEAMEDVHTDSIASMIFHTGTLYGMPAVVVRSGVGKVNAGICTQILCGRYRVDGIINTGIAGSLDADIDIGDIVVSVDLIQHDVDACVWGYAPGEIPQMGICAFPADDNLRNLAVKICRQEIPAVHVYEGRIASGDVFVGSTEKKNWISKTFGARAAEMEGAAIAQAAWLNKIPCIVIRSISDKADQSSVMDYDAFEAMAVEHSVILTQKLVECLSQQGEVDS